MNNLIDELSWLPQPFSITKDPFARDFLLLAYGHANSTSSDPNTRNGSVLVKNNKILVFGTNKFATGVAETRPRLENREIKNMLVVHAETSAIFNAARNGKSTSGTILYCPFVSCTNCSKAIIQSGIRKVVGHAQLMAMASGHASWKQSIQCGWEMMQEAGVKCELFDGTIGVTTRFNCEDIEV